MNIIDKGLYQIVEDGKHIIINYGGRSEWLTYNEEILKILDRWKLHIWIENGVLRTYILDHGVIKFRIYDFAMACYLGIAHVDTFPTDIQNYFNMKGGVLSVDHADNDRRNNTALNLSLMDRQLNGMKFDVTAKFVPPYSIKTAYCNKVYLVEFSQIEDAAYLQWQLNRAGTNSICVGANGVAVLRFTCDSSKSYVELLRYLYETRIEGGIVETRPKEQFVKCKGEFPFADDVAKSIVEQERLEQLDRSLFQLYNSKN